MYDILLLVVYDFGNNNLVEKYTQKGILPIILPYTDIGNNTNIVL